MQAQSKVYKVLHFPGGRRAALGILICADSAGVLIRRDIRRLCTYVEKNLSSFEPYLRSEIRDPGRIFLGKKKKKKKKKKKSDFFF